MGFLDGEGWQEDITSRSLGGWRDEVLERPNHLPGKPRAMSPRQSILYVVIGLGCVPVLSLIRLISVGLNSIVGIGIFL